MLRPSLRSLIVLWFAWGTVILAFQHIITQRLDLRRPDFATDWTALAMAAHSLKAQPYLNELLLNRQVAWDSEFYLAIAVGGYEDPASSATIDPDRASAFRSVMHSSLCIPLSHPCPVFALERI